MSLAIDLPALCDTVHNCLLFVVKTFVYFWIILQLQKFLANFYMWILWKLVKAGNCERFFGNEGKDMKQQKFFTANNKQYMVNGTMTQGGSRILISKDVYQHFMTLC